MAEAINMDFRAAELSMGQQMDERFFAPLKSMDTNVASDTASGTDASNSSGMTIELKGIKDPTNNQSDVYDPGTFKGTMAFGLYNQVTDTLGNNWNQLTDKQKQAMTATRRVTGGG